MGKRVTIIRNFNPSTASMGNPLHLDASYDEMVGVLGKPNILGSVDGKTSVTWNRWAAIGDEVVPIQVYNYKWDFRPDLAGNRKRSGLWSVKTAGGHGSEVRMAIMAGIRAAANHAIAVARTGA